ERRRAQRPAVVRRGERVVRVLDHCGALVARAAQLPVRLAAAHLGGGRAVAVDAEGGELDGGAVVLRGGRALAEGEAEVDGLVGREGAGAAALGEADGGRAGEGARGDGGGGKAVAGGGGGCYAAAGAAGAEYVDVPAGLVADPERVRDGSHVGGLCVVVM
ncbi:hypothetical protein V498_10059, partial [Pseudogymnoascus sp. VKM F-4517 (FW-2822)]